MHHPRIPQHAVTWNAYHIRSISLVAEVVGTAVSFARTYVPVVARVIEPPCGPVCGLLSPCGLRVNHLLSWYCIHSNDEHHTDDYL